MITNTSSFWGTNTHRAVCAVRSARGQSFGDKLLSRVYHLQTEQGRNPNIGSHQGAVAAELRFVNAVRQLSEDDFFSLVGEIEGREEPAFLEKAEACYLEHQNADRPTERSAQYEYNVRERVLQTIIQMEQLPHTGMPARTSQLQLVS